MPDLHCSTYPANQATADLHERRKIRANPDENDLTELLCGRLNAQLNMVPPICFGGVQCAVGSIQYCVDAVVNATIESRHADTRREVPALASRMRDVQ